MINYEFFMFACTGTVVVNLDDGSTVAYGIIFAGTAEEPSRRARGHRTLKRELYRICFN